MKELFLAAFLVLAVILLLMVTPMAFLWSVNSLFGLGIPYTFHSFLAAWVLLFVIRLVTRSNEKNI